MRGFLKELYNCFVEPIVVGFGTGPIPPVPPVEPLWDQDEDEEDDIDGERK